MSTSDTCSRTSLTRFAAVMRDPGPATQHEYAGHLWQQHGAVVITADMLGAMAGLERQLIQAVADKHYGKRKI